MTDKNTKNNSKILITPALIYQILYRKAAGLTDSLSAIKKSMLADGITAKDVAMVDAIYQAYSNPQTNGGIKEMSIEEILESNSDFVNQNKSENKKSKELKKQVKPVVEEDDSADDFSEFF